MGRGLKEDLHYSPLISIVKKDGEYSRETGESGWPVSVITTARRERMEKETGSGRVGKGKREKERKRIQGWKKHSCDFSKKNVRDIARVGALRISKLYDAHAASFFIRGCLSYKARAERREKHGVQGREEGERVLDTPRDTYEIFMALHGFTPFVRVNRRWG